MLTEFNFEDIWRIKHPNIRSYTWSQNSPLVLCRLDYWFTSHNLHDFIENVNITPSIKSDHSLITLQLNSSENNLKGPGFWKLNTSLLQDAEWIKLLKGKISEVKGNFEIFLGVVKV